MPAKPSKRIFAFSVHVLTAAGAAVALFALLAATHGDWPLMFLWLGVALVIDAMDLLHSGRLEGFCLVSSDSDFTRLASRLRLWGKFLRIWNYWNMLNVHDAITPTQRSKTYLGRPSVVLFTIASTAKRPSSSSNHYNIVKNHTCLINLVKPG